MPLDLPFKTKPRLAAEMLRELRAEGIIAFKYVVADSLYGANPDFIGAIEEKVGTTYFVSMPSDTLCWLQGPSTEERTVRGKGGRKVKRVVPEREKKPVDFATLARGINSFEESPCIPFSSEKEIAVQNLSNVVGLRNTGDQYLAQAQPFFSEHLQNAFFDDFFKIFLIYRFPHLSILWCAFSKEPSSSAMLHHFWKISICILNWIIVRIKRQSYDGFGQGTMPHWRSDPLTPFARLSLNFRQTEEICLTFAES
jgi:hypothetical protein